MPSKHKRPPIAFRPPEGVGACLLVYATDTGTPVNRVITQAVTEFLDRNAATETDLPEACYVARPEWDAAKKAADANGETLGDVIRAALRRYVA
jgi:hypothetical protein